MLVSAFVTWMLLCPSTIIEGWYEFQPSRFKYVAKHLGKDVIYGHLDRDGKFTEEFRRKLGGRSNYDPRFVTLDQGDETPTRVFEYRAGGVLVLGTITWDTEFAATPGAPTMPFRGYRYFAGATPIWNLPGKFVLKSEAKRRKSILSPSDLEKLGWSVETYLGNRWVPLYPVEPIALTPTGAATAWESLATLRSFPLTESTGTGAGVQAAWEWSPVLTSFTRTRLLTESANR